MVDQNKAVMTVFSNGYVFVKYPGSPLVTVYNQCCTEEIDAFTDYNLYNDDFKEFEQSCLEQLEYLYAY